VSVPNQDDCTKPCTYKAPYKLCHLWFTQTPTMWAWGLLLSLSPSYQLQSLLREKQFNLASFIFLPHLSSKAGPAIRDKLQKGPLANKPKPSGTSGSVLHQAAKRTRAPIHVACLIIDPSCMHACLHPDVGGLCLLKRKKKWKTPILGPLFDGRNERTQPHRKNFDYHQLFSLKF